MCILPHIHTQIEEKLKKKKTGEGPIFWPSGLGYWAIVSWSVSYYILSSKHKHDV